MTMTDVINKKVSVIVPIYNVEDCLRRCLDSLCRQSLRDIEIILVDDASPDRCGEICEEYAARDSRFIVIHHNKNQGLSGARNTGIAYANCDYLMFVDSDDFVHEDFCKLPYECAVRYQSELVLFRFRYNLYNKTSENSKTTYKFSENVSLLKSGFKTKAEALELLQFYGIWNAAWDKLYHRNLFDSITFPLNYLYEDIGTIYKTILKSNRIYYLDRVLYYHCLRGGSVTTIRTKKALLDWFAMSIQQYNDLEAWGAFPKEKLDSILLKIVFDYCTKKKRNLLDPNYMFCLKTLYNYKIMPSCFTSKQKILLTLLKYCPSLFEFICTLRGRKYSD